DNPSWKRAAGFGVALALAVLAKFSTLAFLPSTAIVALALWIAFEKPGVRRIAGLLRGRAPQFAAALALAMLIVWAGYRFSIGMAPLIGIKAPAPELFAGIDQVLIHNRSGHVTYLLGAVSTTGWLHFFVVALGVKTPLVVLILGVAGAFVLLRRGARGW